MTGASVEFYYSVGSRYSYLAATQIEALERDTGASVEWIPLSSASLMAAAGYRPCDGSRPSDRARRAGAFGVPTFVIGERMFWGNDRLVLVRHALQRRAAPR